MLNLSALILTQNEEKKIERCIRSLDFCSEIIVVDGGSTDSTLSRLAALNDSLHGRIRIFENPWPGFSAQRNFALSQASNEWVLVVDADECVSRELAEKIRALIGQSAERMISASEVSTSGASASSAPSCYKIRRQEYLFGKPYHFGIGNPSYQDRLFKKTGVQYVGDLHEHPQFPQNPGMIEEPILHDPDLTVETILRKTNQYSALDAKRLYQSGRRTNLLSVLLAGPAMFLKNYIYYEAWRDGQTGLLISILEALARVARHLKLWELQRK